MLAISLKVGGQLENHAARFLKMICMVLNCEVELKAVRKHISNTTNQLTSEFPLIPFISTEKVRFGPFKEGYYTLLDLNFFYIVRKPNSTMFYYSSSE